MITMRGIHKSFDRLEVLRGVDLDVRRGEILSIVGASGAGKTTLLQILGTLDRPDSGTVDYEGTRVSDLTGKALARFRNRNIGFIFQFHQLLPEFTMLENVAMPALIGGENRAEAMRRALSSASESNQLLLEDQSRNTAENFRNSKALLEETAWTRKRP